MERKELLRKNLVNCECDSVKIENWYGESIVFYFKVNNMDLVEDDMMLINELMEEDKEFNKCIFNKCKDDFGKVYIEWEMDFGNGLEWWMDKYNEKDENKIKEIIYNEVEDVWSGFDRDIIFYNKNMFIM